MGCKGRIRETHENLGGSRMRCTLLPCWTSSDWSLRDEGLL